MSRPLPSRSFLATTATLAGGQLGAQLILVALTPVITRLYSAEAYGAFSVVLALAVTVMPAACLRLNVAALLPRSNSESNALIVAGALACALLAAVLTLLLIPFYETLAQRLNLRADPWVLLLIPLLLVGGGARLLSDALALRRQHFGLISRAAMGGATADRALSIGLPLAGAAGAAMLIVGRLGNFVVQSVWLLRTVGGIARTDGRFDRKQFVDALKRYRHFAIYAFAVILQQLSRQLPVVMIGVFYSSAATGLYALVMRVLMEPLQLTGAAVGRGFAQRAAIEEHRGGAIGTLGLKLLDYIIALLLAPLALLALAGPILFGWVFGPDWSEAGHILRFLVPVLVLGFAERSVVALFDVYHRQRQQSAFAFAVLGITAAVFASAALGLALEPVLAMYATGFCASSLARIAWILKVAGAPVATTLTTLGRTAGTTGAWLLPALALWALLPEQRATLALLAPLWAIFYLAARFYRDPYLLAALEPWRGR